MEKKFTRKELGNKLWLKNFWYYYRWHMLAGAILLLLAALFTYDMVTQEKFDATITLAVKGYVSEEQADYLATCFEEYGEDYDGDGQVNYFVNPLSFPVSDDGMDMQMQMAMQTKFIAELASGTSQILLLDEATFTQIDEPEAQMDLSAFGFQTTEDSRLVPLGEVFPCEGTPIELMADKVFLVLCAEPGEKQKDSVKLYHASQVALVERIAKGERTAAPVPEPATVQ